MKKIIGLFLICAMLLSMVACSSGVSQEEYDKVVAERDTAIEERDAAIEERDRISSELEVAINDLEVVSKEYEDFKIEAEPFLKMTEDEKAAELARAEKEKIEAEEESRKAKEEADRLAAERAAEEEAKRQAEEAARIEEEAKGYETGITFTDISRSPDDYIGEKVKFTGSVLQILEGSYSNEGRMSTKGSYDDVVYIMYDPDILDVRILEDDEITVYGTFSRMVTYETIMGGSVTLPLINVDRIELHS